MRNIVALQIILLIYTAKNDTKVIPTTTIKSVLIGYRDLKTITEAAQNKIEKFNMNISLHFEDKDC